MSNTVPSSSGFWKRNQQTLAPWLFLAPGNPLGGLYHTMTLLTVCTIAHFYTTGHLTAVTALKALDAEFDLFDDVRGAGLMIGAQLRPAHAGRAGDILDACIGQGLLLLQAGPDVLRFVPALNLTDADVADGIARLRAALVDFVGR